MMAAGRIRQDTAGSEKLLRVHHSCHKAKSHDKLSAYLILGRRKSCEGGREETPGHKVPDGLLKNRIKLFMRMMVTAPECKKYTDTSQGK